jgi:hypothetical protein
VESVVGQLDLELQESTTIKIVSEQKSN